MQFPTEVLRQCWFLAGPTACGKSDVGVVLAEALSGVGPTAGAEIVSLDSMSLYRGMDVGTAKPSESLRSRVPHHLLDVIEPDEEFSLAEYVDAARRVCGEIVSRDRTPLFVGGTGLYLRGVLRGVFAGPPADWEFRRRLEQEAHARGPEFLYHRLQQVDAAAAATWHPNDTRRTIRALEVFHLTSRPLSEQQRQPPLPPDQRPAHVYWLCPPRDWLYRRINDRVEQMFANGLVAEVRRLIAGPQPLSRTARQALGYKEVLDALQTDDGFDSSPTSIADCVDLIQRRTRQFAKRQHTWFRNLVECQAIEMTGDERPDELAARIVGVAKGKLENTKCEWQIP